jgi:hypothetical protein
MESMNCEQTTEWPEPNVTALDIAEIKILMLIKEVSPQEVERILDVNNVDSLEDLDPLTARNLLRYLQTV